MAWFGGRRKRRSPSASGGLKSKQTVFGIFIIFKNKHSGVWMWIEVEILTFPWWVHSDWHSDFLSWKCWIRKQNHSMHVVGFTCPKEKVDKPEQETLTFRLWFCSWVWETVPLGLAWKTCYRKAISPFGSAHEVWPLGGGPKIQSLRKNARKKGLETTPLWKAVAFLRQRVLIGNRDISNKTVFRTNFM